MHRSTAKQITQKHDLSEGLLRFDKYEKFTWDFSAVVFHQLHELSKEDLFKKFTAFMIKNFLKLQKSKPMAFGKATWERVLSVCKQGNIQVSVKEKNVEGCR